jgi:methyl-accepting chemotaxis protein
MVNHIAQSAREQTSATEDVTRSMEEISVLTAENSANIHQVGKSADDISSIATELQQLVGQFRV